jgi:sugar phosphate permease
VGVGAILILPWLQAIILRDGWRSACWTLGVITLVILIPINLIVAKRPQDLGLLPDGAKGAEAGASAAARHARNIVDTEWAATEWTVSRAIRTARFWWLVGGFFCGGFVWYAVQVHQTKYLVEIGFSPMLAAWSLGLVAMVAIPGQIVLGALSDRIGREIVWTISCAGFAICYAALLALAGGPSQTLLYVMVLSQGALGYGFTAMMGPIVAEIYEGPHFGSIFRLVMVSLIAGGAVGPFVTGLLYDLEGNYDTAFALSIALSILCAIAVWLASPGKVRLVAGRAPAR